MTFAPIPVIHSKGYGSPAKIANRQVQLAGHAKMIIDATKPAAPNWYPPRAQVPEDQIDAVDLEKLLKPYSTRRPAREPAGSR